MTTQTELGPADRIIDRHCPDLAPAERALAAERLRGLARVLGRIADQHTTEVPKVDSTQLGAGGRIPSL